MGLFGKSKQDLISRYEKNLKEKDYIIHNLQMENESLKQDIMHKKYEINELMSNQKQYIELNRTDELILCAGRYRGGINIPVGIYDLIIVSGTGIIHSKNPEYVFIRLESNPEICKKNNWPNTYNGFVVSDESVFEIDQSAQIKFILSQKIDLDKEFKKYLDKKNEIEKEIDYLEQIKKSKKQEAGNILILEKGTYYGGKTIPCGIYNLKLISGSSFIETKNPKVYFNIDKEYYSDSYVGLKIGSETILQIKHDAKIEFHQTLSQDELESFSADNVEVKKKQTITELQSKIDELKQYKKSLKDSIEPIKSDLKLKKNELKNIESDINKIKTEKDIASKKYEELKNKVQNELNRSIKLNEEIRNSNYELEYIKNEIDNNKNKLNEINENIKNAKGLAKDKYDQEKNVLDKKLSDTYWEQLNRYSKIQDEINDVKEELEILNNKIIEKYYIFSDYDDISSNDCKNELILLKSKEKKLRDAENDIEIISMNENQKMTERSIRQILRNFNSECNNIMRNISLKNIDIVRNKIQKSYESMNKLYSFDGVSLSHNILELKLKQATLMYTYELKYQQEKDIQQAIKEQMIEEAKAEREIQEQKKKIEKDLQQHIGEVNRLMKYIQKTQIDAEKQLYMDKIKELEEKIKTLEYDKKTVLEREANATAGFVYIISNIGSFGEDIYKIGMTRRLEPMDRVRELSSASVPFEFDVHAMIFSSDAPDLENTLHKHFADKAVNKVNPRKEFYKVDINEIEKIVKENYNDTVQFTKIPIASEYRQSIELYPKIKRDISKDELNQRLYMDIIIEDD